MQQIEPLLRKCSASHARLCPRQILGVRIGLAGMNALGFDKLPAKKQLLILSETDGCFVDGISAATGCTVGHRTLRVEDYGKVAATFVDVGTGCAVRIAPLPDIREKAFDYIRDESRRYFVQLRAYQVMPDDELLSLQEVIMVASLEQIISRPGVRVKCDLCDEEIINGREIVRDGSTLCRACDGDGYYQPVLPLLAPRAESIFE